MADKWADLSEKIRMIKMLKSLIFYEKLAIAAAAALCPVTVAFSLSILLDLPPLVLIASAAAFILVGIIVLIAFGCGQKIKKALTEMRIVEHDGWVKAISHEGGTTIVEYEDGREVNLGHYRLHHQLCIDCNLTRFCVKIIRNGLGHVIEVPTYNYEPRHQP